ncbi:MAG: peptide chain release factor N(5)-glutamine methyltransferase [Silvanigrellales bacterium]|nr:peptide chain release factor N(5)-glutamine methyltransferase [Silvanigrellales bacterium]
MTNETWTVKDILAWTSGRFVQLDLPTPLLDAQLLLSSVVGLSKVQLYMHHDRVLSGDERTRMRDLVRRRISGEPVAYLLGRKDWHELDLLVDARVLIPRPETETLLDFVLDVFRSAGREPARLLDLCTGSGCLAVGLGRRFPRATVVAVDVSAEALAVARENAKRNGAHNVSFLLADVREDGLFTRLLHEAGGAFDVVVANPPYVSESEWTHLDVGVRDFEPRLALVAENEGFALANLLAREVVREGVLSPESVFAMEVGLSHCDLLAGPEAPGHLETFPYNTQSWKFPRARSFALQDLTGRDRFWCRVSGLAFEGVAQESEAQGPDAQAAVDAANVERLERLRLEAEARALAAHSKDDGREPEGHFENV